MPDDGSIASEQFTFKAIDIEWSTLTRDTCDNGPVEGNGIAAGVGWGWWGGGGPGGGSALFSFLQPRTCRKLHRIFVYVL